MYTTLGGPHTMYRSRLISPCSSHELRCMYARYNARWESGESFIRMHNHDPLLPHINVAHTLQKYNINNEFSFGQTGKRDVICMHAMQHVHALVVAGHPLICIQYTPKSNVATPLQTFIHVTKRGALWSVTTIRVFVSVSNGVLFPRSFAIPFAAYPKRWTQPSSRSSTETEHLMTLPNTLPQV